MWFLYELRRAKNSNLYKSLIFPSLFRGKMGRIKTTLIKRITKKLIEEYGERFKDNFEENKKLVQEFADVPSKKLRNIIAGYITRLKKKQGI